MPPFQQRSGRQVHLQSWGNNKSWQSQGKSWNDQSGGASGRGHWQWQPTGSQDDEWMEEGDDEWGEDGWDEEWNEEEGWEDDGGWEDHGNQRSQGNWSQNRRHGGKGGKGGKGKGKGRHHHNRGFKQNNQRGGKKWVKKGEPEAYQEELNGWTGANTIEVAWSPPVKEEEEPKEVVRQPSPVRGPVGRGRQNTLPAWMTKPQNPSIPDQGEGSGPLALTNEPAASSTEPPKERSPSPPRGPAGRGRGSTMPAWMTQGVGNTATAEIDKAPKIEVQDKEHEDRLEKMDEIFAERKGSNNQKGKDAGQKFLALEDKGAKAPPKTIFDVRGKPAQTSLTLTERPAPTLTPAKVQHPWQKQQRTAEQTEDWEGGAEPWDEEWEQEASSSWKGQSSQSKPWRLQQQRWQKPEEWSSAKSEEWSSSSWSWNKNKQNQSQNWNKRKWEGNDDYDRKWQNQKKWDTSWEQTADDPDAMQEDGAEGWDEYANQEAEAEASLKRPKTEQGVPKAFQRLMLQQSERVHPPALPAPPLPAPPPTQVTSLALAAAPKPPPALRDESIAALPAREGWTPAPRFQPTPKNSAPFAIAAKASVQELDEVTQVTQEEADKEATSKCPAPSRPQSTLPSLPQPLGFGEGPPSPPGVAPASAKMPPAPPPPRRRQNNEGLWQLQAQRPKQPSAASGSHLTELSELDRMLPGDYDESMEYEEPAPTPIQAHAVQKPKLPQPLRGSASMTSQRIVGNMQEWERTPPQYQSQHWGGQEQWDAQEMEIQRHIEQQKQSFSEEEKKKAARQEEKRLALLAANRRELEAKQANQQREEWQREQEDRENREREMNRKWQEMQREQREAQEIEQQRQVDEEQWRQQREHSARFLEQQAKDREEEKRQREVMEAQRQREEQERQRLEKQQEAQKRESEAQKKLLHDNDVLEKQIGETLRQEKEGLQQVPKEISPPRQQTPDPPLPKEKAGSSESHPQEAHFEVEDYEKRGLLGIVQEKKRELEEAQRAKEAEKMKKEREQDDEMRRFTQEINMTEEKRKEEAEKQRQQELAAKKREEERQEQIRREQAQARSKEEQRKKEENEKLAKKIQEELAEAQRKEDEAKRLQAARQEQPPPPPSLQEKPATAMTSISSVVQTVIKHNAGQLADQLRSQQTQELLAQQAQMQAQQHNQLQLQDQVYQTQQGFPNTFQQGFQQQGLQQQGLQQGLQQQGFQQQGFPQHGLQQHGFQQHGLQQQGFQPQAMQTNQQNGLLPQNQQFQLHQQQQFVSQPLQPMQQYQPQQNQLQQMLQPQQFQQQPQVQQFGQFGPTALQQQQQQYQMLLQQQQQQAILQQQRMY